MQLKRKLRIPEEFGARGLRIARSRNSSSANQGTFEDTLLSVNEYVYLYNYMLYVRMYSTHKLRIPQESTSRQSRCFFGYFIICK